MGDDGSGAPRVPSYIKKGLLAGGIAFAVVLFFALWIFEDIPGAGDAGAAGGQEWPALEMEQLDTRPVLVLDAGHGGRDPGAVSAEGSVLESDVTQNMVERVMARLEAHAGELLVVQAHEAGTYATPMARADTASALGADLFVSLHLNADQYASTRGFQVFPAPPGRVHHAESTRFAQLVAGYAAEAGAKVMGGDGVYYCYYVQGASGGYSKVILDSTHPGSEEPWEDESFGVLEYPGCPAALVEMWHISNLADMAKFNNELGRAAMAEAVYRAICDYFGLAPLASG